MKDWKEFIAEAQKRDGEVWETEGSWAAQARGVVDYFDSREKAEAYAKGFSPQRRGAFTRTGEQSRETKAKMSAPRSGGRMLGGEVIGEARDRGKNFKPPQSRDGKDALRMIDDWEEKMKMVQDQIDFLKTKRLGEMEKKLKTAYQKYREGDYGWIQRELFFNADLY